MASSIQIGEAIEQEAKSESVLDKTKRKLVCLGKQVTHLINKQKVPQIRCIVKANDDSNPWGLEIQAKVGSKLIELLMQTALVQATLDHSYDGPPEIRLVFIDATKGSKRFGVIQCDPKVWKSVENSDTHTIIPYMPMLALPVDWIGYDKGPYFKELHLKEHQMTS